jgi:hypothetical protein
MNKVVVFFLAMICSLSVSSQVRLNEIFPANNGQNKQWIELFSSGASLSNYTLAIRYKLSTTDSGFYLMSLSGTANANNYFVVENNGNVNWVNTSQIKKISWAGVSQALTATESNQILQSSGENFIFLVKNNKVLDALVTYLNRIPKEFGILCMTMAVRRDKELSQTHGFTKWTTSNLKVLF